MASSVTFVIFLMVVLRATFSLPIAQDVTTVQSNSEAALTGSTVIGVETLLNLEEEIELVQSLSTETVLNAFESVEAVHGRRVKRDVIRPKGFCPGDTYQYGNQCLTKEKFDEYNDVDGSDDYVAES